MIEWDRVVVEEAEDQPNLFEQENEGIANMDETDWMAMMMEMRIISA